MKKIFLSLIFHVSPFLFFGLFAYLVYEIYIAIERVPSYIDLIIGSVLFYPICVFFHNLCHKYWLVYIRTQFARDEAWDLYEKNVSIVHTGNSLVLAKKRGEQILGTKNI